MITSVRRKPNSKDRLKKAQLSLYVEPEDYTRLKALSARTGIPQQVYLRCGLMHVLQQESMLPQSEDSISQATGLIGASSRLAS